MAGGASVGFAQDGMSGIPEYVTRVRAQYSIELLYKDIPQPQGTTALYQEVHPRNYSKLLAFLKILEEELGRYPSRFFEFSQLQQIYLVEKCFHHDRPMEGLYNDRDRVILLEIARGSNPIRQRHNIHHELFHMMERSVQRMVRLDEEEWSKLNKDHFVYGQPSRYKESESFSSPPREGFATVYSLTSPQEDRAEIYACLMVRSQNRLLSKWMGSDPILKQKVEYIKRFIVAYCPEMDERYWDRLFKGTGNVPGEDGSREKENFSGR